MADSRSTRKSRGSELSRLLRRRPEWVTRCPDGVLSSEVVLMDG